MDSIKMFLENMFYGINETPAVLNAKKELLAMMEDKYNTLKAEGKSENEAVGQVISEFGNLDELAEDLGISDAVESSRTAGTKSEKIMPRQFLSDGEVDQFLVHKKGFARRIAFGVLLLIISPTVLIATGTFFGDDITEKMSLPGLIFLFFAIAVAVGLFVISGVADEKHEALEHRVALLNDSKRREINDIYERERMPFATTIAVGIGLILAGVVLVIVASVLGQTERWAGLGVIALLICVAIAVYMFINSGIRRGSLEQLLNTGSYTPDKRRADSLSEKIAGPYWMIVVAAYLAWSFSTNNWQITWIIWPISGVLFAIVNSVAESVHKD